MSICLSVCLPAWLAGWLAICLSVCLAVCLSVCLSSVYLYIDILQYIHYIHLYIYIYNIYDIWTRYSMSRFHCWSKVFSAAWFQQNNATAPLTHRYCKVGLKWPACGWSGRGKHVDAGHKSKKTTSNQIHVYMWISWYKNTLNTCWSTNNAGIANCMLITHSNNHIATAKEKDQHLSAGLAERG